jgi:hypothetical protein
MAYILEHIKRSEEARKTAETNPRQELQEYLNAPLRTSGTDIVKWWGVSITLTD